MLKSWREVKNYLNSGWRYQLRRNVIDHPFDSLMCVFLICITSVLVLGLGWIVKICIEDNTGKLIEKSLDNPESSKWEKIDSVTWYRPNSSSLKHSHTYRMIVPNGYLYRVVTIGYGNVTESIIFVPSNQLDTKSQPW